MHHRHTAIARALRSIAGALAIALLAPPLSPATAVAAAQKTVTLAFADDLLASIATDSQGEHTAEIIDRIIGLSPALLNARLQRTSGRVSLFLTTSAAADVPVEFQLTLDKMAYYRMRTARTDAAGMTQALQEAKSFEPLLLEVAYRYDGRYAIIDCTVDLGPALEASRQVRERRAAEAKSAAAEKAAEDARVAEESRATAALKAAAEAKAATRGAAQPAAPAAAPATGAATAPAAVPAAAAIDPATESRGAARKAVRAPEPVQHESRFLARALGREVEPDVDGLFSDAAWLAADRFTFEVRGASGRIPVAAWALWSPERLWLMLRWPDRSRDIAHRSWIWSEEAKSYVPGREVEDALSLSFAREGRLGECMLAGREADGDVWTWRAGRTDPSGFAEDGTLAVRLTSFANAVSVPGRNGGAVWVRVEPDAGASPYEALPAGEYAGERIPGFASRTPSGSAGDVLAKGSWKDGFWLVEFSRRLYTGDPADAVLTPGRDAHVSIAVFNSREGADHSTSEEIVLRLE